MPEPIFISYKRVDKDKVFKIKDFIERETGLSCWIDLEGIESDAYFKKVIIRAINDCEVMLFMYSKAHSQISENGSDWTEKELHFATKKNKRIVFVKIDGTELTDFFEFDYGTKQQIDARKQEALTKLATDLRHWLCPEPKKELIVNPLQNLKRKRVSMPATYYSLELVRQAEAGNPEAQFNLGKCFYNGDGVEKDLKEAVKWYRKAAEQGNGNAQNNLGFCYRFGYGVEKDYFEAVNWYRKAAEQGNPSGQYNLGCCYDNGFVVAKDPVEAIKWYHKAASQGNNNAIKRLQELESQKTNDSASAEQKYLAAAQAGDSNAQNALGDFYRCEKMNYSEAVKWYRKAAEQGNNKAQYNLGYCYECGLGVTHSLGLAKKWYQTSMEHGNANARNKLKQIDETMPANNEKPEENVVTKLVNRFNKWLKS